MRYLAMTRSPNNQLEVLFAGDDGETQADLWARVRTTLRRLYDATGRSEESVQRDYLDEMGRIVLIEASTENVVAHREALSRYFLSVQTRVKERESRCG